MTEVGMIVMFKGTKSRGDKWDEFISNPHFKDQDETSIYGKVHCIRGDEIWLHIYDWDNKLLDNCTWGFLEEDLFDPDEDNEDYHFNPFETEDPFALMNETDKIIETQNKIDEVIETKEMK